MSNQELNKVFGNYTSGEIEGATKALQWAAEQLANSNHFTKEQTKALNRLVELNEELREFFMTNLPTGFAAQSFERFNNFKQNIIKELEDPIREIVKEENRKLKIELVSIVGLLVSLVSAVFWWLENSAVSDLIELLKAKGLL